MKQEFVVPDFSTGSLELRIKGGEVCIYGTPEGLRWLGEKCLKLGTRTTCQHVHLEDYQVTTPESAPCVLAVFPSSESGG